MKKTPSKEELEEIKEAVKKAGMEGRITLAPTDEAEEYEAECYEFIERVFGVKAALITDESSTADFPKLKGGWRRLTAQMFNIPLPESINMRIVDVAKAIRKARAH